MITERTVLLLRDPFLAMCAIAGTMLIRNQSGSLRYWCADIIHMFILCSSCRTHGLICTLPSSFSLLSRAFNALMSARYSSGMPLRRDRHFALAYFDFPGFERSGQFSNTISKLRNGLSLKLSGCVEFATGRWLVQESVSLEDVFIGLPHFLPHFDFSYIFEESIRLLVRCLGLPIRLYDLAVDSCISHQGLVC